MNTHSIRFRLIVWYAGLLTAVFVLLGGLMYGALSHYLLADLRNTQIWRARQIADTLLKNVKQTGEGVVVSEIQSLYAPETNGRFIRITRPDGSVLYSSGPAKDQSFDPSGLPTLIPIPSKLVVRTQILDRNKTLLIAALPQRVTAEKPYLIEVGAVTTSIETMVNQLLVLLGIGLPIVVMVGIGGGYFLIGRALAPVNEIARKAEQITQHNLSERLPVARTAEELEQLTHALNHMIGRLEDAVLNSKRFVADASHELRTPLTVLRSELESFVREKSLMRAERLKIGSLLEEVERLAKIVEQLFAVSRLDAGEAQVEWTQFDLAELVITTTDQMSLMAEDKGLTVKCEAPEPVTVAGDRARMKQVVVNLLDNAIKYTPINGSITLRVVEDNGRAVLEIADTGIGIPMEAQPHIFKRFFRVDKARARDAGGVGLGLSIVKAICVAHGADIEVESNDNTGSLFRVRWPLAGSERNHYDKKN
jgi:heavy metal sensor kinase